MYQVRTELGIADDVKVVIFNFGGQVSGEIVSLRFVDALLFSIA